MSAASQDSPTPRGWTCPAPMQNAVVRLEPLEHRHLRGLFEATPPDTFVHFTMRPEIWTWEAFEAFFAPFAAEESISPYAVLDAVTGAPLGSSTFLDIRPAHRGVEIGFTWYAAAARGTRVNPACKLLLMEHAFERLNCERVQLKCDARNLRSQAAIARLGGVREGVLRRHIVMPDGFVRDTVMFSVVRAEWERVKAGLLARLAPQNAAG